MLFTDREKSQN
jgi:hypothetical protein